MPMRNPGKFAMGIYTAGLDVNAGISNGSLAVMQEPLTGLHGEKACLVFQNSIMMSREQPIPRPAPRPSWSGTSST